MQYVTMVCIVPNRGPHWEPVVPAPAMRLGGRAGAFDATRRLPLFWFDHVYGPGSAQAYGILMYDCVADADMAWHQLCRMWTREEFAKAAKDQGHTPPIERPADAERRLTITIRMRMLQLLVRQVQGKISRARQPGWWWECEAAASSPKLDFIDLANANWGPEYGTVEEYGIAEDLQELRRG